MAMREKGQSLVEYALIAALCAVAMIAALMMFGTQISNSFDNLRGGLAEKGFNGTWIPERSPIAILYDDFRSRTLAYYKEYGKWPPKKAPKNFTSLGLDPDDWSDPVHGILWTPRGENIRLKNIKGDDIQIFVDDMDGNTLQVYDGWKILCPVTESSCYLQSVEPGNEVDIESIQFVEE